MEEGNTDSGVEEDNEGESKSIHSRELSFSGWCHGDGVGGSDSPPENSEAEADNREPKDLADKKPWLAYWDFRSAFGLAEGNGNSTNYHPLDVEQGAISVKSDSSFEVLSAKVVLKILFYILLWYTFSTCLTL